MKLVREHIIFEKFTEENSDPIRDMGIGLIHKLKQEYQAAYTNNWNKPDIESITLHQLMNFCLNRAGYDVEVIDALISAGVDVKDKDSHYLNYAKNRGIEYVKLLLDRGANPRANRCEAFVNAVFNKKIDIAELLLKAGANVHAGGDLALRQAVKFNHTEIAEWLIEKGAKCNTRNYYALSTALRNKNLKLADIFAKEYVKDRGI